MIYTPNRIGQLIKETRTGMGLTQEQLALTAGTGLRFIIDLEKGKPTCQVGLVLTVLNTLGIKITLTSPVAEVGAGKGTEGKSNCGTQNKRTE